MKIGSTARLTQVVIQGPIAGKRYDESTDGLEYLVVYKDRDGEVQQRWFPESQLEQVEVAA